MSCEQAIYAGVIPKYPPFSITNVQNIAECSQNCCNTNEENRSCGIFSYIPSATSANQASCLLFQLPDQPYYMPFPSIRDMNKTEPNVVTGILMKRKIVTWIPILMMLIILLFTLWSIQTS